jgi:NitT/TauT family transport system permease protein
VSAPKSAGASTTTIRIGAAALVAALLLLWAFAVKLTTNSLLPGPVAVAEGIIELAEKGLLIKYIVASLFRVTWGFLLAAVLAIPIGLAIGLSRRAEMAINPIIQVLRPISPLAWIPIAILWFGVGDISAIFLIFLASFLPLCLTSINAVSSVADIHLNAGRNFGLKPHQIIFDVLLPAVTPQLILGLRITLGIAWLVVVAAEMIAVNSGLGFLIVDARNSGNRYDLVIAGMILIGAIGLLLDIGVRALEKLPSVAWGYSDD